MDQNQPVRRRSLSPSARESSVTLTLIAINLAVWLVLRATGGIQGFLYGYLALHPTGSCYVSGDGYYVGITANVCNSAGAWYPGIVDGAWWMILTSAFTHIDLLHIGFNMLALYILGPPVERALGHSRFLTIYIFSALTGSAAVYLLSSPASSTLGASGAIFGLMGTVLILSYLYRGDMTNILIWLGMNIALTFMLGSQISWQGHLGGLVGGIFAGWLFGRPAPRPSWPPVPGEKVRKQNPWLGLAAGIVVLAAVFVARTLVLSP
jgi:membrane associated rhomboid family serine protease